MTVTDNVFNQRGCEDITGYSPDELINNRVISFNDIMTGLSAANMDWIIALREKSLNLSIRFIIKWRNALGMGAVEYLL